MVAPAAEYKRLPGRSRRLGGYSRLYLAPGHLLYVESSGYSEMYRRFYFSDIEAILVRPTRRRLIWNLILAPLVIPPLLPALFGAYIEAVILGAVLSAPLLIFVLVNSLLGQACVTHIQSAAQTTSIRSLRRLRPADRAMRIITPLIQQSQPGSQEMSAKVAQFVTERAGAARA